MNIFKKYTALFITLVVFSSCLPVYAEAKTDYTHNKLLELPFEDAAGEVKFQETEVCDALVDSELTGGNITDSCFDPRPGKSNFEDNLFTIPRLQGSYNTCWAFSSLACAEASYNRHLGIYGQEAYNLKRDFSESYFAKLVYNKEADYNDPLNILNGTEYYITASPGSKLSLSQRISLGASLMTAQDVMAMGAGPVSEEKYPYSEIISGGMPKGNTYESEAVFESGYIVPTYDHNTIKRMILQYGGVSTGYYHETSAYNNINGEYYFNNNMPNINHGIVIVGWDDNCPKENFKNLPAQDGAWLIRNSQTSSLSYFWMSYDTLDYYKTHAATKSNVNGYIFNIRPKAGKERLYEYDGSIPNYKIDYKKVYVAFDAKDTLENEIEYISGVNFKAYGSGTKFIVSLYKNVLPEEITTADPETSSEVTIEADGYTHINFDKEVPVKKGDRFAVVMEINDGGGVYFTGNADSTLSKSLGYILKTKYNIGDTIPTSNFAYFLEDNADSCIINKNIYIPRIKATSVIRDSITGEIVPEEKNDNPTATAVPTLTTTPTDAVQIPTATAAPDPATAAAVPTATAAPDSATATAAAAPTVTTAPDPATATAVPTATAAPDPATATAVPTATAAPDSATTTAAAAPTVTTAPDPATATAAAAPTVTTAPDPATATAAAAPTVTTAPDPATATAAAVPTVTTAPDPATAAAVPTVTTAPDPTTATAIPTVTTAPDPATAAALPTVTTAPDPATAAAIPTVTTAPDSAIPSNEKIDCNAAEIIIPAPKAENSKNAPLQLNISANASASMDRIVNISGATMTISQVITAAGKASNSPKQKPTVKISQNDVLILYSKAKISSNITANKNTIKSDDPKIAIVKANGIIKPGKKPGVTKLTAGTISFNVINLAGEATPVLKDTKINTNKILVKAGNEFAFKVNLPLNSEVTYSNSKGFINKAGLTLSNDGQFLVYGQAAKKGSVKIIFTCNGKKKNFFLKVTE